MGSCCVCRHKICRPTRIDMNVKNSLSQQTGDGESGSLKPTEAQSIRRELAEVMIRYCPLSLNYFYLSYDFVAKVLEI